MNNKETKRVTQEEIISILNTIEKPTFTHIVTETIVRMNKGKTKEGNNEPNPYHNKVTKVKSGNFFIGIDYENRVNNNDKKEGGEGNFETQENKVGEHISKCILFNEKLKIFGNFFLISIAVSSIVWVILFNLFNPLFAVSSIISNI